MLLLFLESWQFTPQPCSLWVWFHSLHTRSKPRASTSSLKQSWLEIWRRVFSQETTFIAFPMIFSEQFEQIISSWLDSTASSFLALILILIRIHQFIFPSLSKIPTFIKCPSLDDTNAGYLYNCSHWSHYETWPLLSVSALIANEYPTDHDSSNKYFLLSWDLWCLESKFPWSESRPPALTQHTAHLIPDTL